MCFKSLLNIYRTMCTMHREDWELAEQCLGLWGFLKGDETWYEEPDILAERIKENLLWKFKKWYEILTLPGADRSWTPLSEMNKICSEEAGIRSCRNRSCDTRYHKEYLQLLSSQVLYLQMDRIIAHMKWKGHRKYQVIRFLKCYVIVGEIMQSILNDSFPNF